MSIFKKGCQKTDHSYINDERLEKGGHRIPGSADIGGIRHALTYYVIHR